ncbi:MAG: hypothetical protein HRT90_05775 [Candidatus Margulisbacteria bacterium]|nr:hypothetical protein [Candidatus Margulisiibacteriota bacterium]
MLKSVLLFGFVLTLFSGVWADVKIERVTGNIELQEVVTAFDEAAMVKVPFGKNLQGVSKIYIDNFFGKKIVKAIPSIKNPTSEVRYCQYYVAFFDEDGLLIGSTGQGGYLSAGSEFQFSNCTIPLPEEEIAKITSYQVILYESAEEIGRN